MAPLIFAAPLPPSVLFLLSIPLTSPEPREGPKREKEGLGGEASALNSLKEGSEESEDVDLTLEGDVNNQLPRKKTLYIL